MPARAGCSPLSLRSSMASLGERELDNDFVFVFIGGIPPFKLLRDFGIKFGDEVAAAAPAA